MSPEAWVACVRASVRGAGALANTVEHLLAAKVWWAYANVVAERTLCNKESYRKSQLFLNSSETRDLGNNLFDSTCNDANNIMFWSTALLHMFTFPS